MSEVEIRVVDWEHREDLNIPNEPFDLFGRMLPSYENGKWSYTTEEFETVSEMCFPDENYNYEELSKNHIILGAYAKETCVGLAILCHAWFRYMYLYDLKVNRTFRGKGVAAKLMAAARRVSAENGYRGIYTQGQDNNLGACLFYIRDGFRIGGLNTEVYLGTAQEGKYDIYFYTENESGKKA